MDMILKIAIISFVIAIIAGWLLNSLIIVLFRIFRTGKFNTFPSAKSQLVYAFLSGIALFIIGVIIFLTNVEMH